MSDQPILCATCKVQAKLSIESDAQGTVLCPKCGNSDTLENVKRSLGLQAKEYAARTMQQSFRNAARGSKFLKFKPSVIPKQDHAFILQIES